MPKKKYYAYFIPSTRETGVTDTWSVCERKTSGVAGARYRSFADAASARGWLSMGAEYQVRPKVAAPRVKLKPGVYFDAGTGRGDGVEISVTDEHGKNILSLVSGSKKINKFGKMNMPAWATNNYGELMACRYAIEAATLKKIKHIFGDSKLIIDYWSLGIAKEKDLPEETVRLIRKVTKLREEFEAAGGEVGRVSGAQNPADLGFH